MRKLYIMAASVVLLCLLTACTQAETTIEDIHGPADASSETDSLGGASKVILADSAGTTIAQTIEGADGKTIDIDAEVCVDGISRVSYYRYVPQPLTDEFRKNLLKRMYPAETWDVNDAVVYDKEKDTWEFVTPLGENWIYQVWDSQIPGEQILNHERVGIALDASKDNLLGVVLIQNDAEDPRLIELLGTLSTEIDQIGKMAIDSVMETDNYSCSDIYIYGNNGRQPYARAVFKQTIDGMPVTSWNNFSTVTIADDVMPV